MDCQSVLRYQTQLSNKNYLSDCGTGIAPVSVRNSLSKNDCSSKSETDLSESKMTQALVGLQVKGYFFKTQNFYII
jgi:hypothetical protein